MVHSKVCGVRLEFVIASAEGGGMVWESVGKADLLSDHFDRKQSREIVELPLTCHPSPSLTIFLFRSSEVRRLLLDLDLMVALTNPVGMFPLFLKRTADVMAHRLSVVFRRLVRLGSFPACWRQANVTPILKGPPSSSVANCRPVSITSVLSKCLSAWCRFLLHDVCNAVVCFQPPSLVIGKILVPVMHLCACPIHCTVNWRVGRRLGSCKLISLQSLIVFNHLGILYKLCSVGVGGSVLSMLTQFYQTDHSTLWWMVVGVDWLTLCQECRRVVFWPVIVPPVHFGAFFFHLEKLTDRWCWWLHFDGCCAIPRRQGCLTQQSLIRDLIRVSEWCDLWGMKLNASKTKTMIVSRSRLSQCIPSHPH